MATAAQKHLENTLISENAFHLKPINLNCGRGEEYVWFGFELRSGHV